MTLLRKSRSLGVRLRDWGMSGDGVDVLNVKNVV